ncbi:LysR family transcriptional regulator [Rhodococcus sp. H29-C3]|uniref:LysR family transcriptional regulator n=1 Tax=Rhodococcus sp. H29-C3 TaxID=3046307 RepID=UPI0024B8AF6F|nr:LysR family transcriptional regulator [Rhodococcus sp. H29-C3]MDJ0362258.1 LysR family transcriptional regulator [Rhodococcus sp. H29-C3]
MIDFARLQVLRSIQHHGSVSEAARVMHLTPSAVSQQVRQLVIDVGVELLERDGRSTRLTSAANVLLGYAHRAARSWEEMLAELHAVDGGEHLAGRLAVCSFATAIPALVAPAATAMITAAAGAATVAIREAGTADSLTLLLQRAADLAVIAAPANPEFDDPRFEQHPLIDDPQDLVVGAQTAFAEFGMCRLADLGREAWIEPHRDQRALIEAACTMDGFVPRFEHQADDWNSVLALVRADMGVCLYPRMAPIDIPGVRRIPLTGTNAPVRRVFTCVRAGSAEQPLITAYRDRLREQAGRTPQGEATPHGTH